MEDGATARESTDNYSSVTLPPTPSSSSSTSSIQRPHRCDTCQRAFREVATLRKHEQLHRADRPYVCQTCGKSFLWSSNLKVHERVHTGERPYKCKICHRCFTQSNDLRRHERNVHMRGKLCAYRQGAQGAGRGAGGSQVNLAAYQAFAMQQRAILQQALTYEGYLHGSSVPQNPSVFPQRTNPHLVNTKEAMAACRPSRSGLGNGLEETSHRNSLHRSIVKAEPAPTMASCGEREGQGMGSKRMMINASCSDPEALQHGPHALQHSPMSLQHSPGSMQNTSATLSNGPSTMGHSPTTTQHSPGALQHNLANLQHCAVTLQQGSVSPRFLPSSSCPGPLPLPPPLTSHPIMLAVSHGSYPAKPTSPLHPSTTLLRTPPTTRHPLPSFNSFRHPPSSSTDYQSGRGSAPMPPLLPAVLCEVSNGVIVDGREREEYHEKQACDSIMDLSLNKNLAARPASSSGSYRQSEDGDPDVAPVPPLKTPGSESESEEKRDVTTTSSTPVADNGIHHCQHCNIVFSDYTMFHLHESLHMPYESYPFRCPSCGKHCQDRIEFMFHTVWHVKYPHTIPNYEPFKENLVS